MFLFSVIFFASTKGHKKKHGRIRAYDNTCLDKSNCKTCNSSINKIEDDATGDAKEESDDGQAFLSVLEEQANEAQQGTKSAQNQANEVKNRNPANNQANQGQDKTSDGTAVLSFDDLIHYKFPSTCRAQLLVSVD